ncbi:inositol monophosphatase [Candidatus Dependentiae bacterium]|nr:inositol monophosphatase [Candidatus Dependentiae bacterium]
MVQLLSEFFVDQLIASVRQVGDKLLQESRYNDAEAQQELIAQLQLLLPQAGIIAEEGTIAQSAEYTWVIDPLDGTTNRAIGLPCWCVSVALMRAELPIVGVIYAPALRQLFTTTMFNTVLYNNASVVVADRPLAQGIIATSFPRRMAPAYRHHWQLLAALRDRSYSMRSIGSIALESAYVAAGIVDVVIVPAARWWDIAAGIALIQAAGGLILQGGSPRKEQQLFIACTPAVAEQLQSLLLHYL